MVLKILENEDGLEKECFDLMNQNPGTIDYVTFSSQFQDGIKNGEIYIDRISYWVMSYAKGKVEEIKGMRFFHLKHLASSLPDWVHFLHKIFLMQNEKFDYVAYYRKKNHSVYLAKLSLQTDYFKIKRIKGGVPCC
jgi:hypothetical protein